MHAFYPKTYRSSFEFGSKRSAALQGSDWRRQGGRRAAAASSLKNDGGLDQGGSNEGGEKGVEGSDV